MLLDEEDDEEAEREETMAGMAGVVTVRSRDERRTERHSGAIKRKMDNAERGLRAVLSEMVPVPVAADSIISMFSGGLAMLSSSETLLLVLLMSPIVDVFGIFGLIKCGSSGLRLAATSVIGSTSTLGDSISGSRVSGYRRTTGS